MGSSESSKRQMGEVGRFFFDGGGGDEGGLCEPGFTRGRPRPRFRRLGVALARLVGGETGAQPETLKLASPATPVFVADDNPQLSAPSMGVTTTHAAFSALCLFLCVVLEPPACVLFLCACVCFAKMEREREEGCREDKKRGKRKAKRRIENGGVKRDERGG